VCDCAVRKDVGLPMENASWRRVAVHIGRTPIRLKAPNQLGLYDRSGNVWEWCEHVFAPDVGCIPAGGSATTGAEPERVLRGGSFHKWAIHCTMVAWASLAWGI